MIPSIGLMIGAYIITRMVELLIGSDKKTTRFLSIVTLGVTVLCRCFHLRHADRARVRVTHGSRHNGGRLPLASNHIQDVHTLCLEIRGPVRKRLASRIDRVCRPIAKMGRYRSKITVSPTVKQLQKPS